MVTIGLTGELGVGKSTVAGFFCQKGAAVLDADSLAHRLMEPNQPVFRKVVKKFGPQILKNGRIDRAQLGRMVFADPRKLRILNRLVHPATISAIKSHVRGIGRRHPRAIIVIEVPLLIETGLDRWVDHCLVVKASRKKQLERLQKSRRLSRTQALKIIQNQMSTKTKMKYADFVIDNGGSLPATKKQVERIWEQLKHF